MKQYEEMIFKAKKLFKRNEEDFERFYSPGRVNLIGEHIDYNGGVVLPCPLDFGTYGVVAKRNDELVRCFSENFKELGIVTFIIDEFKYEVKDEWVNFVKGIINEMNKDGYVFNHGFDLYIKGTIPNGAGLSSSASLELLLGVMLRDMYYLDYSNLDLVKIGQRCENNYMGVKCGIMDQFVIGLGKKHKAILLQTSTLKYEYVDADFKPYKIVIGNTNYRRTLSDSKYNERRSECETALEIIKNYKTIDNLCELTITEFENIKNKIDDEVLKRRVKHVVYENDRTKEAVKCLNNRDFIRFARLLCESHKSLKEDYEVTGLPLDSLVDSFMEYGALGARMTGAGFGGCMIALVEENKIEEMLPKVKEKYRLLTGLSADFYIANVGDGAQKVEGEKND